jgi:hypothetical protein
MAKSIDTPIFLCYNTLRDNLEMSIKIALLKSGESVIADIKELVQEDQIRGYLFKDAFAVNLTPKYGFLAEESDLEEEDDGELNVSFTPWMPLTNDKEIPVRYDWLVTIVNPANEIQKLYEEMINGEDNQTDSTDEQ